MAYPQTKTTYVKAEVEARLPYKTIAEVCDGPLWKKPDRKSRYTAAFNRAERDNLRRIIERAKTWTAKGVPVKCSISDSSLNLWIRLGKFCESLKTQAARRTPASIVSTSFCSNSKL